MYMFINTYIKKLGLEWSHICTFKEQILSQMEYDALQVSSY